MRWLLVLMAITLGWLAGAHLQATQAQRAWEEAARRERNAALPTTQPGAGEASAERPLPTVK